MNYLIKHFQILAMIVITLSCAACSSDNEESDITLYDFTVDYYVHVVDEQGNNLIDPTNPENILDQNICVLYNGKEYPLSNNTPQSRTYLNEFSGISVVTTPKPALFIGTWDGSSSKIEEFTLDWGDGSPAETFKFRSETKEKQGKLYQHLTTWLNGKEFQDTKNLTIVKSSR